MTHWKPALGDVLHFHEKLIARTGGAGGIRDDALIESALGRFDAAYDGHEIYPTLHEKAAAVCYGLVQNHGFIDGNKRIGVEVLRLILVMNGIEIVYTQSELITLGLSIARDEMDVEQVAEWINKHCI